MDVSIPKEQDGNLWQHSVPRSAQSRMLRATAAHCKPGYHLEFCSVCSFVEFSLGRRRLGFLGVRQFVVFIETYLICYFW